MLKEKHPENLFIDLNQALSNSEARTLHAMEMNITQFRNVFFIFNRSSTRILEDEDLTNLNHWAVGAILESREVIFADPLYNAMPLNFLNFIDDFYKVKYGKRIKQKNCVNLSGRKNFPSQRDSSLCGLIALMIVVLLQSQTMVDFFKFNTFRVSLNQLDDLVKWPSSYKVYLRKVFITAYCENEISVNSFLSSEALEKIEKLLDFDKRDQAQYGASVEKGRQENFVEDPRKRRRKTKNMKAKEEVTPTKKRFFIFDEELLIDEGHESTKDEESAFLNRKKVLKQNTIKRTKLKESFIMEDCFEDTEEDKKEKPVNDPSLKPSEKKKEGKKEKPVNEPSLKPSERKKEDKKEKPVNDPSLKPNEKKKEDKKEKPVNDPSLKPSEKKKEGKKEKPVNEPSLEQNENKEHNFNPKDSRTGQNQLEIHEEEKLEKENIVLPNFTGMIVIKRKSKISNIKCQFKNSDSLVKIDGYSWKRLTAKNRKKVYKCTNENNGIGCSAVKTLKVPFDTKKRQDGLVEVHYLSCHSICKPPRTNLEEEDVSKSKLFENAGSGTSVNFEANEQDLFNTSNFFESSQENNQVENNENKIENELNKSTEKENSASRMDGTTNESVEDSFRSSHPKNVTRTWNFGSDSCR